MPSQEPALWKAPSALVVSDTTTDVPAIINAARQLRDRERNQLAANIEAGHYEVVATFVWHKTMALLKKQLSTLGNQFVAELLQRSEIDEYSDILTAISDSEALSLARDLGIISATQAMRLSHSQQAISHFASFDSADVDDDAGMTPEEAVLCLRVCVQGVLGQETIAVAQDFAAFRTKLESITLAADSEEIIQLLQSPYFFIRTAISVLLTLLKSAKGVSLEHAARNAITIIPLVWDKLKNPERWQVGQAYAVEFSEGKKDAVRSLHAILLQVKGFDYVPENLRSQTFIKVANSIIAAHQGLNNFHNEPGPMRELAALGSSIPGPALASCMTAVLCVKLGNRYGVSWSAQPSADGLLSSISRDRWIYYLDGRLEQDRIILPKLAEEGPRGRWIDLIRNSGVQAEEIKTKAVRDLVKATLENNGDRVSTISARLWKESLGV